MIVPPTKKTPVEFPIIWIVVPFCLILSLVITIEGIRSFVLDEEILGLLVCSVIDVIVVPLSIYFIFKGQKSKAEALAQYEKELAQFMLEHPHYEEENFYDLCTEKFGIKGTSAADVARMRLAIQEIGYAWSEDELAQRFEIGQQAKQNYQKLKKKEAADTRAQKRKEEAENKLREQCVHSDYVKTRLSMSGVSKRVESIENEITEYLEKAKQEHQEGSKLFSVGTDYLNAVNRESSDWAIVGGIAEGIAGPAAGVMAASIQHEKDEQNRQEKKQGADLLLFASYQAAQPHFDRAREYKARAKELKQELELVKISIWQDACDQMELLHVLNPVISITKTTKLPGLLCATLTFHPAKTMIYETVDAYVDGFFRVIIKKGNEVIDEFFDELPGNGSLCQDMSFTYYIKGTKKDEFTATVEPVRLWGIEDKKEK